MQSLSEGAAANIGSPSGPNVVSDTLPVLVEGRKRAYVERGVLIVIIVAVVVAIFTPVGVLIEEFLDIESGSGGVGHAIPFNYEESCVMENVVSESYGPAHSAVAILCIDFDLAERPKMLAKNCQRVKRVREMATPYFAYIIVSASSWVFSVAILKF